MTGGADLDRLRGLTGIKWNWHDDDVLAAWVADMDFAPPPVVVDALQALIDRGDFGYNFDALQHIPGAFAEWQARRHGWSPDPDRLRVICDVLQAVDLVLWQCTRPGDGIVLFTPSYPPFFGMIENGGRRLIECPLDEDGWRIDPAALEAAIDDTTSAILLCNPHNPTGRVFDAEELAAVAEAAERHDLLVVSDEIWQDLVYPGARHVPAPLAAGGGIAQRCVTVTAASKTFNLAGLRCAIAHYGNDEVFETIERIPSHALGAVGSPGAEATRAAWTQGEPWLGETLVHLERMRDHVATRLGEELPEVGFSSPEATYLAWLDMRDTPFAEQPARHLLEHGRVGLSDGSDFGARGAGFVRLNFATSIAILDGVIDRMVSALR